MRCKRSVKPGNNIDGGITHSGGNYLSLGGKRRISNL